MPYVVSTAATVYPVSASTLKAHLRVDSSDEDTILTQYLAAATAWVEDYTKRPLITRTMTLTLDTFPSSGEIVLPFSPVTAISSVKYYDTAAAQQTLSSSAYWSVLNEIDGPGRIILKSTESWPDLQEDRPRAVEVIFVCGYGATEDVSVPSEIRSAILLLAAHYFENRLPIITGTIVAEVGFTVLSLLGPRRFYSFA